MTSLELKTNNRIVEINGETYRLDFDMQALSFAEQLYLEHYGRDVNVTEIIRELYAMKMSALAVFIYGAMRSAGEKVTWEQFSKRIFTYTNFYALFEVALDAIEALLAPYKGNAPATTDEKN
jgi:hypothetical protein